MLLCALDDISPGTVIGAAVLHPGAPDVELLKPGVVLDHALLARLRQMGVTQLWVEADITGDLAPAAGVELTRIKRELLAGLKTDLATLSRQTVGVGQYQRYRQVIMDLVCELIGSGKYAGLADAIFGTECGLLTHSTNVAHLSVMVGLDLETYIVRQRKWLAPEAAWDMVTLGLAGMLHDIGKVRLGAGAAEWGEVFGGSDARADKEPDGYRDHPTVGHRLLRESRAAARVCQAVLNHHRRFDGSGWPEESATPAANGADAARLGGGGAAPARENRDSGGDAPRTLHIFTRIVSAANVLDNLRRRAACDGQPPVAALHAFAGPRYDGWFDPVVRTALLRRVHPFPVGADLRLSDGRRAAVIAPNPGAPCRPIVRIIPNAAADPTPAEQIDLAARPDLRVARYLGADVGRWLYDVPQAAPPIAAAA